MSYDLMIKTQLKTLQQILVIYLQSHLKAHSTLMKSTGVQIFKKTFILKVTLIGKRDKH